jgi:hypothetical protein
MPEFNVGDRVLVKSALAFAKVVATEATGIGTRYTVEFPEGDRLSRYAAELIGPH